VGTRRAACGKAHGTEWIRYLTLCNTRHGGNTMALLYLNNMSLPYLINCGSISCKPTWLHMYSKLGPPIFPLKETLVHFSDLFLLWPTFCFVLPTLQHTTTTTTTSSIKVHTTTHTYDPTAAIRPPSLLVPRPVSRTLPPTPSCN
jgi:hypothetical protein